jgi:hypothetical protein
LQFHDLLRHASPIGYSFADSKLSVSIVSEAKDSPSFGQND